MPASPRFVRVFRSLRFVRGFRFLQGVRERLQKISYSDSLHRHRYPTFVAAHRSRSSLSASQMHLNQLSGPHVRVASHRVPTIRNQEEHLSDRSDRRSRRQTRRRGQEILKELYRETAGNSEGHILAAPPLGATVRRLMVHVAL
jgi:hypothetical protein